MKLIFFLLPCFTYGQQTIRESVKEALATEELKEYHASNGVTYHIGDSVLLGNGAGMNKDFLWCNVFIKTKILLTPKGNISNLTHSSANYKFKITKIVRYLKSGILMLESYSYVRGISKIETIYQFRIEDAIKDCEILPCAKESPHDKYEQLKRLKELLDSGAITKEEYEIEKKKILGAN